MAQLLGLSLLSLFITAILIIPFIDFLYKVKLRRKLQKTVDPFNKPTPFFDKTNSWKVGTPFGGGILIIFVVIALYLWTFAFLNFETSFWLVFVLLFSFVGFGILGLYDDIKKLGLGVKNPFFGLRLRHKFAIQWALALVIASILFYKLNYSFIFITGFGLVDLGLLYIILASFAIVSFANAFNIADGLDGLASGLLLICLGAFLAISVAQLDPGLGTFIAILMGSVAAFLYFNIFKARIWLGDVGSMSLGAVLAVIGLLTGKIIALVVIGGVFIIEVGSSLIQLLSKKFLGKKVFPVAPFHLLLLHRGWEEPKVVMRVWLFGFFFAILGLFIALIQ
ncbi:MAG: phospho-N-acetylmuramoyl-pentapeptide-transferase [Candidatus Levybacteria bacterium]|nr:phospho-N-acetylmuramoyl-pentapeptide-transferase [Candidatus Levybacteria bacterium]MBI2420476.1 phospho-N-acetylmuramoyl-pentapeptide-transferase [Candidatus Levybacteria bacterium]MBI4098266.1 phospho-N-acetylmuramoyl-pentapeptide-transferase [Candidatus Levybacteria bacterium]